MPGRRPPDGVGHDPVHHVHRPRVHPTRLPHPGRSDPMSAEQILEEVHSDLVFSADTGQSNLGYYGYDRDIKGGDTITFEAETYTADGEVDQSYVVTVTVKRVTR